MKGKKILVTGAYGFLGYRLTEKLVEHSAEVTAIYHRHKKHIPKIKVA